MASSFSDHKLGFQARYVKCIIPLDLTGKPIRTAQFFGGVPGAKREWIIAGVCHEFECTEDDVACAEPDENSQTGRDVLMVRGAVVGEIA